MKLILERGGVGGGYVITTILWQDKDHVMGPRGARVVLVDWPRRSLLPVRLCKVFVIDNILVPMLFLQVRESSRCSHRRLRYGCT